MSDPDVCLSCDYGQPQKDPQVFGFCGECQTSGRAELYLSMLAFQDGDEDEALRLFKLARRKGVFEGLGKD